MPVDTKKYQLDALNYTVSAVIILVCLAIILAVTFENYHLANIFVGIANSFLVLAMLFLCYGLWLLTKIAKLNDSQAKFGMMSIHILAYVLMVVSEYSYYIK